MANFDELDLEINLRDVKKKKKFIQPPSYKRQKLNNNVSKVARIAEQIEAIDEQDALEKAAEVVGGPKLKNKIANKHLMKNIISPQMRKQIDRYERVFGNQKDEYNIHPLGIEVNPTAPKNLEIFSSNHFKMMPDGGWGRVVTKKMDPEKKDELLAKNLAFKEKKQKIRAEDKAAEYLHKPDIKKNMEFFAKEMDEALQYLDENNMIGYYRPNKLANINPNKKSRIRWGRLSVLSDQYTNSGGLAGVNHLINSKKMSPRIFRLLKFVKNYNSFVKAARSLKREKDHYKDPNPLKDEKYLKKHISRQYQRRIKQVMDHNGLKDVNEVTSKHWEKYIKDKTELYKTKQQKWLESHPNSSGGIWTKHLLNLQQFKVSEKGSNDKVLLPNTALSVKDPLFALIKSDASTGDEIVDREIKNERDRVNMGALFMRGKIIGKGYRNKNLSAAQALFNKDSNFKSGTWENWLPLRDRLLLDRIDETQNDTLDALIDPNLRSERKLNQALGISVGIHVNHRLNKRGGRRSKNYGFVYVNGYIDDNIFFDIYDAISKLQTSNKVNILSSKFLTSYTLFIERVKGFFNQIMLNSVWNEQRRMWDFWKELIIKFAKRFDYIKLVWGASASAKSYLLGDKPLENHPLIKTYWGGIKDWAAGWTSEYPAVDDIENDAKEKLQNTIEAFLVTKVAWTDKDYIDKFIQFLDVLCAVLITVHSVSYDEYTKNLVEANYKIWTQNFNKVFALPSNNRQKEKRSKEAAAAMEELTGQEALQKSANLGEGNA